jgi:hypothetical protein
MDISSQAATRSLLARGCRQTEQIATDRRLSMHARMLSMQHQSSFSWLPYAPQVLIDQAQGR